MTATAVVAACRTAARARSRRRAAPLVRGLPLRPAVVLLLVFLAGPIVYCVYVAFTDIALTGADEHPTSSALDNFRRAFADPASVNRCRLTLVFTLLSRPWSARTRWGWRWRC